MISEVFENNRTPEEVIHEYTGEHVILPEEIFEWKLKELSLLSIEAIEQKFAETNPVEFEPLQYPIYTPPHRYRSYHQMFRGPALECYDHFLASMDERTKIIKEFLGVQNKLDYSTESMKLLDELFPEAVLSCKFSCKIEMPLVGVQCMSQDVGIYFGNTVIKHIEPVDWQFYVSNKSSKSYQHPVLMGFNIPYKGYCFNPVITIQSYASRLLALKRYGIKTDFFSSWLAKLKHMNLTGKR
jgi:hypothetical protein